MQGLGKCSLPCGSGRALMLGTFVLAAAAAVVLVVGAQDARLLRLGLVAALWAALFGAFAVAQMRREINSATDRVDELRTVYQLELEREVAARREHELTVERELREQAEHAEKSERDDIAVLRTELAAMRANLENLLTADHLMERVAPRAQSLAAQSLGAQPLGAQSRRLLPLPDRLPSSDEGRSRAVAPGVLAMAAPSRTAAGSLTVRNEASLAPCDGPEPRFGPSARNGRHGTPSGESSGPNGNGSNSNGSHASSNGSHASNGSHSKNGSPSKNGSHGHGGGSRRVPEPEPAVFSAAQRSVSDLLAANGGGPVPRRRRSREAG